MLIERELTVHSVKRDSLDIRPRAESCYSGFCDPYPDHAFATPIYAAGFKYQICNRCGTVRISELPSCTCNLANEPSAKEHASYCPAGSEEPCNHRFDFIPFKGIVCTKCGAVATTETVPLHHTEHHWVKQGSGTICDLCGAVSTTSIDARDAKP